AVRLDEEAERDVGISATERRADVVIHIIMLDATWSTSQRPGERSRQNRAGNPECGPHGCASHEQCGGNPSIDRQAQRARGSFWGVWIVGRPRIGVAWALSVAALTTWPAQPQRAHSACDIAFDAKEWQRVATECRDPRWGERAR